MIDSEHYLSTWMRVIELNLERAGMADDPGEYSWSSYLFNTHGKPDALVAPHTFYWRLGRTEQVHQSAYRKLFHAKFSEVGILPSARPPMLWVMTDSGRGLKR